MRILLIHPQVDSRKLDGHARVPEISVPRNLYHSAGLRGSADPREETSLAELFRAAPSVK